MGQRPLLLLVVIDIAHHQFVILFTYEDILKKTSEIIKSILVVSFMRKQIAPINKSPNKLKDRSLAKKEFFIILATTYFKELTKV